jgi:hypothetical protein
MVIQKTIYRVTIITSSDQIYIFKGGKLERKVKNCLFFDFLKQHEDSISFYIWLSFNYSFCKLMRFLELDYILVLG